MKLMMLRTAALSLLLMSCLGLSQGVAKVQKDRTKALDAAATTPFFTKRGAESVKRVITGADERKEDEKVLDPTGAKGQPAQAQPGQGQPGPGQPTQGQGAPAPNQPAAPPAEPVFGWRLVGISYGKHRGMALFQSTGESKTVGNGSTLDQETKIVSVTKSSVVVLFHGKRLELIPW